MIPQTRRHDAGIAQPKGGRLPAEQHCQQQVVIDNNRVAHQHLCQVGIFGSDTGSECRVSARFFDRLSEQAAQPVAVCGDDQQGVTKIGDLDWSAIGNVPSATSLGRQRHLAPVRDVMENNRHTDILQDETVQLQEFEADAGPDGD
ncbi:MAG: hypothetical protein OXC00_13690 [Acidimicrobiaceae bacterium]|nr:hypothetical protein [Acidimicrobiaceae bacterium]